MEKNMQLKPYAIPQEHLKGIKGGLNSQKHTIQCPSCASTANIESKTNPPEYECKSCGCTWRVVLKDGSYSTQIIKEGKK